jgi:hypothetical protein
MSICLDKGKTPTCAKRVAGPFRAGPFLDRVVLECKSVAVLSFARFFVVGMKIKL